MKKVTFGQLPPTKNDIIIQKLLNLMSNNPAQNKYQLNNLLNKSRRGIKHKGFSGKMLSFANVLEMIEMLEETSEIVQIKNIIK